VAENHSRLFPISDYLFLCSTLYAFSNYQYVATLWLKTKTDYLFLPITDYLSTLYALRLSALRLASCAVHLAPCTLHFAPCTLIFLNIFKRNLLQPLLLQQPGDPLYNCSSYLKFHRQVRILVRDINTGSDNKMNLIAFH